MGSRLLCCVALCLLGAGPLDAAVFQTPKYLVARAGDTKSLRCEQKLGHDAMYWYKQDSKQLLKVMFAYNNKEPFLNETVPSRFVPESPDKAHLKLHIKSLELGDSAVYLCASSRDTALQSHCLPLHKPPGPARKRWGQQVQPARGSLHPSVRPLTGVVSMAQPIIPNRVVLQFMHQKCYRIPRTSYSRGF